MNYITSLVVCPGMDCPVAPQCMRYTNYLAEKDSNPVLQLLNMNLVTITSEGCEHVHIAQKVTMARGFKNLYHAVPHNAAQNTWRSFPVSSSRRDFYRLLSGDKPLTPEQQTKVLHYFESLGVNTAIGFDSYEEATI